MCIRYTLLPMPMQTPAMSRRKFRAATGAALIATAVLVAGCGQSGPLYLPPPAKHAQPPATAAAPAPASVTSRR